MKIFRTQLLLSASLVLGGQKLSAEEGMWTFDNLPLSQLESSYGFTPSADWITNVKNSLVRISSGGTGSFVSKNGLVMTNWHVAQGPLQKISSPDNDLMTKGFYAALLADEKQVPNLYIDQLRSITDVTARVAAAIAGATDETEENRLRNAELEEIQSEHQASTGEIGEVVTLYKGGQYHLYGYKRFTDVRMVFAPEKTMGFFGGDEDNFEYPRFVLDIAMLRVYENGVPAQVSNFLPISEKGPQKDDLQFVVGNPGKTSRLLTHAALMDEKYHRLPLSLEILNRNLKTLDSYSERSPEALRQAEAKRFSVSNSLKVSLGKEKLLDESILAAKLASETALKARVFTDEALSSELGAWTEVERTVSILQDLRLPHALFEEGSAFDTRFFGWARKLVRAAREKQLPEDQRLPEYGTSQLPKLERDLFSEEPIYPELEQATLAASLEFLKLKLPEHALTQEILGDVSPEQRAEEMIRTTRLREISVRREIYTGGTEALARYASDPLIKLATQVDETSRSLRKRLETRVKVPTERAYKRITRVLFAYNGASIYPDATFSPRLSFGSVKGYVQDGVPLKENTVIGGAFAHETAHGAREFFQLPASWHAARSQLNMDTPLNYVTTNDIIGGNSGSAVVDRDGYFAGIVFDGNRYGILGDYHYRIDDNRGISVHSAGILEALRKVYKTERILAEFSIKGRSSSNPCSNKLK